jgi:hypothetical protein
LTTALRRRLILPLVATLAAVGVGSPATADHHCAAVLRVDSNWNIDGQMGFHGSVTVTNMRDSDTAGWRVTLRFRNPDQVTVVVAWNSELLPGGPPYQLSNAPWNGVLPPGGKATAGFQATGPARQGDVLRVGCTPL